MSVAEYLKVNAKGEENAIVAPELIGALGVPTESQLRSIVNDERVSGHPICSSAKGYYYAATTKEAKECYSRLSSRANKILDAANGLLVGAWNIE